MHNETIRLVHFSSLPLTVRNGEIVAGVVPGLSADDLLLELSYLTSKIRSATMDGKAARKMLGEDLARSFHSLVADMRGAMYLGEVPDGPEVKQGDGKCGLNYSLGDLAVLEVEPIGVGVIDSRNWRDVHRVRLLRILDNGKVLA